MSVVFKTQFHEHNRPKVYLDVETPTGPFGRLVIELFPDIVPIAANEFLAHCTGHYGPSYVGCHFERIAPGFVAQINSPTSMLPVDLAVMSSSVGESCDHHIDMECLNPLSFDRRGRVGLMFHPESRKLTPQFFIAFGEAKYLDGTYFVVGQVDLSDPNCADALDRLEEAGLTVEMVFSSTDTFDDIPYTELVGICRRDIVIRRAGVCDSDRAIPLGSAEEAKSNQSPFSTTSASSTTTAPEIRSTTTSASSSSTLASSSTTSAGTQHAEVSDG